MPGPDMRWLGPVILMLLTVPAGAQVLNYGEIFERPNLTGDWGGERPKLEDQGIQLGGDEILDIQGNLNSGMRRGAVVEGRLELFANIDMAKTLGLDGLIFHANAYQIHGRGLTSHYLRNLVTVSNVEATPCTTL